MTKQMHFFSFNPPRDLVEGSKWLLAVSSSECTNSVFIITDENNSSSISTAGHWNSENGEELSNDLNELSELRSENDI